MLALTARPALAGGARTTKAYGRYIGRHTEDRILYLPAYFEESRTDVMHALMRARPLATLVRLSEGHCGRLHARH